MHNKFGNFTMFPFVGFFCNPMIQQKGKPKENPAERKPQRRISMYVPKKDIAST